jgi:hypothetical protein
LNQTDGCFLISWRLLHLLVESLWPSFRTEVCSHIQSEYQTLVEMVLFVDQTAFALVGERRRSGLPAEPGAIGVELYPRHRRRLSGCAICILQSFFSPKNGESDWLADLSLN